MAILVYQVIQVNQVIAGKYGKSGTSGNTCKTVHKYTGTQIHIQYLQYPAGGRRQDHLLLCLIAPILQEVR